MNARTQQANFADGDLVQRMKWLKVTKLAFGPKTANRKQGPSCYQARGNRRGGRQIDHVVNIYTDTHIQYNLDTKLLLCV